MNWNLVPSPQTHTHTHILVHLRVDMDPSTSRMESPHTIKILHYRPRQLNRRCCVCDHAHCTTSFDHFETFCDTLLTTTLDCLSFSSVDKAATRFLISFLKTCLADLRAMLTHRHLVGETIANSRHLFRAESRSVRKLQISELSCHFVCSNCFCKQMFWQMQMQGLLCRNRGI